MQTREAYKALIRHEVFGNRRLSLWQKARRMYREPSLAAVYRIRAFQYHVSRSGFWHRWRAGRHSAVLCRRFQIFVGSRTQIGRGLVLPHPTGIVLGQAVKIGENCRIFQHVTVGSRRNGDYKRGLQPNIGKDCTLFSGCAVIGDVTLGDGVQIGANAVMNKNALPGSVWAGVPARCLSKEV